MHTHKQPLPDPKSTPHRDMELSLGQKAMRSLILSYAILNLSLCFSIAGQATRAVKKKIN